MIRNMQENSLEKEKRSRTTPVGSIRPHRRYQLACYFIHVPALATVLASPLGLLMSLRCNSCPQYSIGDRRCPIWPMKKKSHYEIAPALLAAPLPQSRPPCDPMPYSNAFRQTARFCVRVLRSFLEFPAPSYRPLLLNDFDTVKIPSPECPIFP